MSDLRDFIKELIAEKDLSYVKVVSPNVDYEVGAFIRKSCDEEGPALLMDVRDNKYLYNNRLIGSVYGARRRIRKILTKYPGEQISDFEAVKRYCECADKSSPIRYISNNEKNVECQSVVIAGDAVDLYKLPICTHNELDSGRFITAGIQIVKWIDGITHGLGIHRMKVVDKNTLACLAPPNRRIGFPHYQAQKEGKGVSMAVIIGASPSLMLASQAKIPFNESKYEVAANINDLRNFNTGLDLVKCLTNDLYVPRDCEIVIECETVPNSSHDDTPFGEYPGTYSMRSNAWLCKVKAITMRKNALYETILTGMVPQEDSNLCAIPMAAEIYRAAKPMVEDVTDISVFIGNNVFDTIVCIKKNSNEEVENLMHVLLGNRYIKSVTIMDDDLNATEIDWRFAFNTRYQPNRNTIITNLGLGASLDPSSPLFQSTSKIGFDFTRPIGKTAQETEYNIKRHAVVKAKQCDLGINSLIPVLSEDWLDE